MPSATRHAVAPLVVLALVLCLSPSRPAARSQSPIQMLLDSYSQRTRLTVVSELAGRDDLVSLGVALRRSGPAWARAGTDPRKRRLIVATLALEIAGAGLERDWNSLRDLVEFGCQLLREDVTPLPLERTWHHAALALAEGALDRPLLGDEAGPLPLRAPPARHLDHIDNRFPGDDRVRLGRVFLNESRLITEAARDRAWRPLDQPPADQLEAGMRLKWKEVARVQAELTPLTVRPRIAGEAFLRRGYRSFQVFDDTGALADFKAALPSDDAFVAYLAHFFTSRVHHRAGRADAEEAELRQALAVSPGVQSSLESLSVLLLMGGKADLAIAELNRPQPGPRPPDPWRLYGYGDFRRWPSLIVELRRGLD
jgi:hypothetical protein